MRASTTASSATSRSPFSRRCDRGARGHPLAAADRLTPRAARRRRFPLATARPRRRPEGRGSARDRANRPPVPMLPGGIAPFSPQAREKGSPGDQQPCNESFDGRPDVDLHAGPFSASVSSVLQASRQRNWLIPHQAEPGEADRRPTTTRLSVWRRPHACPNSKPASQKSWSKLMATWHRSASITAKLEASV